MIIVSYNQAKSYLSVMQEILEENESANSLMLGVLLRLQNEPEQFKHVPFLRTTHDTQGLLAAAVQTPPKSVLFYHDRPNFYSDSLGIFAVDLFQNNFNPPGVLAQREVADAFANIWSSVSGMATELALRERLYECAEVRYKAEASGDLREPKPDELPMIIEWAEAMESEFGLPEAGQDTEARITHFFKTHALFVWADASRAVSMVLKTRPTRNTISISGVYTPPSLRNRGFASAAVSTLTRRLLDSGIKKCVLFTDLGNPTSNAIYQRIGYIPVVDYNFHKFTRQPLTR